MIVKKLFALSVLTLGVILAGCASAPVERVERDTLPYEITVRPNGPARVSSDGFESHFVFEITSPHNLHRNSMVQELRQTVRLIDEDGDAKEHRLTLVEAFRLRFTHRDARGWYNYAIAIGQTDRHSMRGMDGLDDDIVAVEIERDVFAYVANVIGADFTPRGFAHLPKNEDGSVETRVGEKFNEEYQKRHDTRGMILHSGDKLGVTYRIRWRMVRAEPGNPHFFVDRGDGYGIVLAPSVIQIR